MSVLYFLFLLFFDFPVNAVSKELSSWRRMQREAPDEAEDIMLQHVSGKSRRDWQGLVKVVNVWTRRREVTDRTKLKEVSKRKFYLKHRQLGYSADRIDSKWEAATSAERFRMGLARRQGKKVFTFMPKSRDRQC